ncbi:methionyl-tRNA formyltransferase [uncultured Campylobacter sp.]|uniref:methionyl-tRNA formyltransferase n=1 Tax=uncultured Campylobacter sp. TaxID=218934 RepID=UPI00261948E1|nr:methionyl-tRNA formyltransferase [uncultured Campylobacter sp.]
MGKKIIFMGTPSYAATILQALINSGFNVLAIFTQPDKAVGRKQILSASEVKILGLNNNIDVFTPNNLKDEQISKLISSLNPDFIVVAAYGKILPKNILDICPCINLHASLLPKYRGASPIQSAILNGDEESGVCSMLMQESLDSGDILEKTSFSIKNKKADEVFELMSKEAAKLCISTLNNFYKIKPQAQDESKATFCKKIKKSDGLVNLEDAKTLYQKFLAFYPWPGVFLENGLKFIDINLIDDISKNKEAEILDIQGESFLLACKKGVLKINKIQEAGKKICSAKSYLNGKRLKSGNYLY